jgi:hypothetical protein
VCNMKILREVLNVCQKMLQVAMSSHIVGVAIKAFSLSH